MLKFWKVSRNQVVESNTSYGEKSEPSQEVTGSYYRVYKKREAITVQERSMRLNQRRVKVSNTDQ